MSRRDREAENAEKRPHPRRPTDPSVIFRAMPKFDATFSTSSKFRCLIPFSPRDAAAGRKCRPS